MSSTASAEKSRQSPTITADADTRDETRTRSPDEYDKLSGEAKFKPFRNPFKLPVDTDYAKLLQEEKHLQKFKFKEMLTCPVHEKTPARHLSLTKVMLTIPSIPEIPERPPSPTSEIKNDPAFVQALGKGEKLRNMEDLTTFIHNKRKMFLIRYLIGVKRDEIIRLVGKEQKGEETLTTSEKWLEEDAVKFSDFLRLNDREAVEAVKQAEMETRGKLDKVAEIKKINVLIVNYKSKISKLEDILLEYKLYAKFLNNVAPQEWKEKKRKERQQLLETKARLRAEMLKERNDKYEKSLEKSKRAFVGTTSSSLQLQALAQRKAVRKPKEKQVSHAKGEHELDDHLPSTSANAALITEMVVELQLSSDLVHYMVEDEDDEKVELYFTSPDQLPAIFTELEEKNLRLIQKCQESEEALEEIQVNYQNIKKNMEKETKIIRERVELVARLLEWETEKASEFRAIVEMHTFGELDEAAQEQLLQKLKAQIEEVYTKSLGPNDANLNSLQMMTGIENKLEVLLETLEKLPANKVAEAMKLRERQRRMMARVSKVKEVEDYLRQRKLRTMAKAMEVRSTFLRRKVMIRSEPPAVQKIAQKLKHLSRNEEELVYFFT